MGRIPGAFLLAVAILAGAPAAQTPLPQSIGPQNQSAGNPDIKVWVDTAHGIYHCPGSKYYGTAKPGVYMTQKQAQDKGNRPAFGWVCR